MIDQRVLTTVGVGLIPNPNSIPVDIEQAVTDILASGRDLLSTMVAILELRQPLPPGVEGVARIFQIESDATGKVLAIRQGDVVRTATELVRNEECSPGYIQGSLF